MIGDEIAGRIEALNWFLIELVAELEESGVMAAGRLAERIRLRPGMDDQLEYVRIAHQRLGQLAKALESDRADRQGGQIPAA